MAAIGKMALCGRNAPEGIDHEDSGDMLARANTVENLAELYESQKRLVELVQLLNRAIIKLKPYDTFPHINKFILQFEASLRKAEA